MKVIAIDGIDCVGKETQCKLLYNYLNSLGYKVKLISFPNYIIKSGREIQDYLSGSVDLDVYKASKLFTDNRLDTLKDMDLTGYDYVILDRYTSANIIHQSIKLDTEQDVKNYIDWLLNLEYNKLKLPKPDYNIILYLDIETSNKLLSTRGNKCGIQNDIHETDNLYRAKLNDHVKWVSNYLGYSLIDCNSVDGIRSKETIHLDILKVIDK